MFEKYSSYAVLLVSFGVFVLLSSCAVCQYGIGNAPSAVKAYRDFVETQHRQACKEVILHNVISEKRVTCEHPDHNLIVFGSDVHCRCK